MPYKLFFLRLKCAFYNRILFPVYRVFFIRPVHKRMKKKTKVFWDALEAAKKSGDKTEIIKAAIRLNQSLSEFHQQPKDQSDEHILAVAAKVAD
jgi:hypothetical protein